MSEISEMFRQAKEKLDAARNGKPPPQLLAAIAYVRHGMPVFPCQPGGKQPRVQHWKTDATKDEAVIRAWWTENRDLNNAVPCGEVSGITVLDVDGEEGRATLRQLELEHGELPETPIAVTGSGGAHYYFAYEPGLSNAVRFAPGLDIRTDGGYVVGVGSKTTGPYFWEEIAKMGDVPLGAMPGWLVDLIKAGTSSTGQGFVATQKPIQKGEGRNNYLYRMGRSLKAKNFPDKAIGVALDTCNLEQCQPPLDQRELRHLIDQVISQPDRAEFLVPQNGNGNLPALPEVGEIDRTPIDAYEAYELMKADRREHSWEGLIRTGCTMVLTALIGAGKTTLATNVVQGWSAGEDVLGRACRKSKSLVVVSPKEFEAWAEIVHFFGLREQVYLIPSYKTHFPTGSEQARWFEETMIKLGCETFVLDTLFDFYGMPPNIHGDANRIAMTEQVPLLEIVRAHNWSGLVTGHSPKSEAQALVNRDPEEAFAGHTAWTAQHRMRAVIRRKASGVNAFITGRGGYGDKGILKEEMLLFDETSRLVSLGGPFADYLGQTAVDSIMNALEGWMGRTDLVNATGKGKAWVKAGVRYGLKTGVLKTNGKGGRSIKYARSDEPNEAEQGELL